MILWLEFYVSLCDFYDDYGMFCVAFMCECYNTMAKHFKAKKGFEIKRVSRLHCASPHFFCVFCEMGYVSALG